MNDEKKIFIKTIAPSLVSWLLLIALTFISVYLTNFLDSRGLLISGALFIVFLKGQQIIDVFMELKYAPKRWRLLLLSYVVVIPFVITIIYLV
jgi:cytochrome c oxidase subunit IV